VIEVTGPQLDVPALAELNEVLRIAASKT